MFCGDGVEMMDVIGTSATQRTICNALLVDDDRQCRIFLRDLLERESFVVYEASNGAIALQVAKHIVPELIVTDLVMPFTSGFELIAALRNNRCDARILATTGFGSLRGKTYLDVATMLGADAVLLKPFTVGSFRETLSEMFDDISSKYN